MQGMKMDTKVKKTSKIVPIIFFILFLLTCGLKSDIGGFFLVLSMFSWLICKIMDMGRASTGATFAADATSESDWDTTKGWDSSESFLDEMHGCSISEAISGSPQALVDSESHVFYSLHNDDETFKN